MSTCAEGDCGKPAGYEILTHDDTYEKFCEEHARPYYAEWPFGPSALGALLGESGSETE